MILEDKSPRETEQACAAALYDPVAWTDLAERLPQPDRHVMVKMQDGNIDIGFWNSAQSDWSHSPFERWSRPVAWTALPPIHTANVFGR